MDRNVEDTRRQLAMLWRSKWFILGMSALFGVAAATASFFVPPQYEGTVEVAAVAAPSSNGSMGALGSQLGGIAALAGLSPGGDSATNEAMAVLQSESLTERYIQANNLLPILYAKDWDAAKGAWKPMDPEKTPSLWKANREFERKIRKVITAKTGLVTLTITWRDPKLAAEWANGLVRMANDSIRDRAIRASERNIAYLNEEAAKTNIVEARQVIFSIMQTEINKSMVARGSEEYAFKVIDPATISELPSSPQKKLWTLGGLAAGFLFAVFVVTMRFSISG
jgi:uncharacterized protein involved in exopolysaccharide biosynthesis